MSTGGYGLCHDEPVNLEMLLVRLCRELETRIAVAGLPGGRGRLAGRQVMFFGHIFIDLSVQISCFVTI